MNATSITHGEDARTTVEGTEPFMTPEDAFVHGALMVFVDALQTGEIMALFKFPCGKRFYDLANHHSQINSQSKISFSSSSANRLDVMHRTSRTKCVLPPSTLKMILTLSWVRSKFPGVPNWSTDVPTTLHSVPPRLLPMPCV